MAKISVIIPVYNAEKYLGECLDSILGQTLEDIEVFCIDDGSTDSSGAILQDYARRDGRVKLLRTEQVGAYKARREGYDRATGEFLYFMDADDALSTDAFAKLYAMATDGNLDHIVFLATVFTDADDTGRHVRVYRDKFSSRYEISPELLDKVMTGRELFSALNAANCFFPSPPLRLIRTSILKENEFGFPEARYHGDNYFTTVSFLYARRACAIGDKFYRRRIRTDSMTTSMDTEREQFVSTFNVILELCRFKPFAGLLAAGDKGARRYLRKLLGSLSRWALKLDARARSEEIARIGTDAERAFLLNCFLPQLLANASDRKPTTLPGRIRNAVARLLGRSR